MVTGATSGIGRATAEAFSHHGTRLVLVARDVDALEAVAADCRTKGSDALVIPVDIADDDAAEEIANRASETFGRIDAWVNVAAVLAAGPLTAAPVEDLRREIDVNVTGTLLASRAALATFERQGAGVLVNVSSMLSVIPNPLVPAYVMSKAAVRGLSLALRQSVWGRGDIHVCVVVPGPVDTPMFEHAANRTGHGLRAIPPAYAPERLAAAIVGCVRRPRRQVTAGVISRSMLAAHAVAPRATEWALGQYSQLLLIRPEEAAAASGNLHAPTDPTEAHGGWRLGAARRRMGEAWGRHLASKDPAGDRLARGAHSTRGPGAAALADGRVTTRVAAP